MFLGHVRESTTAMCFWVSMYVCCVAGGEVGHLFDKRKKEAEKQSLS